MRSLLHYIDLNCLDVCVLYKVEHSPQCPYIQTLRDMASFLTSSHSGAGWFFIEHLSGAVLSTISLTARLESTPVLINSSCQEQVLICFYRTLMSLDYDSVEVGRFPALRRLEQP